MPEVECRSCKKRGFESSMLPGGYCSSECAPKSRRLKQTRGFKKEVKNLNPWLPNKQEIKRLGNRVRKAKRINLWSKENRDRWIKIRYAVFLRDGKRCALCGIENGRLHIDHIKPMSRYPELAWDIKNLQVLCEACNLGKSDKDDTDWRTPQQTANGA